MQERSTRLFLHCGRFAIMLAAGGLLGTALGNFAIGEDLMPGAIAERPVLGNPDALVPDVQMTTAAYEGPTTVTCKGCDPPPFRRWYDGEQQRISSHLAETDYTPGDTEYGYDRYGNLYYDDGAYDALSRGLPEKTVEEATPPVRETLAPARVDVSAVPPAVRLTDTSSD